MRSKTDCWRRLYCGIIPVVLLFASNAYGITNVVPQAFEVYGGTIGVIDAIEVAGTKTRIFASTDSANSVFYADVDYSSPTPFGTNFIFRVIPDMDANANFGAPEWIAAHQQSGRVFVGCSSGLLSCTTSSGSLVTNINDPIEFVLIKNSRLFAISDAVPENPRNLYYGTLNASGNLALGAALGTNFYGSSVSLAISPVSNKVYLLCSQQAGFALYKSVDDYDAFSAATVFTPVSTTGVTVTDVGQVAVGPDGRLFLGGGNDCKVAWSDNEGSSWTNLVLSSGLGSSGKLNIVCNGPSNAYEVYFGTWVSSNRGATGTWTQFPRGGFQPPATHVNGGSTKVDPLSSNVIYFTTDKGIGGSTNVGVDLMELNNGLLAFQINDIDALADKSVAWIGSKAGMRRAANFNTTPVWTDGDFPDAIVYSVAIDSTDTSGMTGYAGSCRLYKTTTGGGTNAASWVQVFNWTNYSLTDGEIRSVKAKGSFVALGYYSYAQNSPSGGVYISSNGGSNWVPAITNINVNDLLGRNESGARVVYAAVSKSTTADRGGIYRIASSTVTLDMTNEVNICKMAEDSIGGIYASGTIPDTSEPGRHRIVAYYRASNVSGWEQIAASGLPGNLWDGDVLGRGLGPVITVGKDNSSNDVPVLAAVRTLYYLPDGGSSWVTVTNYPNGTQIKALFWDELMVGTTIGLYGQGLQTASSSWVVTGDFDNDGKADFAVVDADGYWTIWWSTADYTPYRSAAPLYVAGGVPVAADFDNDHKADMAMVGPDGCWTIWWSTADYTPYRSAAPLYVAGGVPVAADFDNDHKADMAMVAPNGIWTIWWSTADYTPYSSAAPLYVAGGVPVAADFDNDHKADMAMVGPDGYWTIWWLTADYAPFSSAAPLYVAGGVPVAGDFDNDHKADPTVVGPDGVWTILWSSADYVPVHTIPLIP